MGGMMIDPTWAVATLLVGSVAWVLGTGLRRGAFLSPFSLVLLILVSVFGVRPLLMPDVSASFDFYGYDIRDGYELATVLGFVGTASFVTGYAVRRLFRLRPTVKRSAPRPVSPPSLPKLTPGRAVFAAWALMSGWLVVMVVVGGGASFIGTLFAGRSAEVNRALEGVPAIVPALPMVGCLVVAAVRFQHERVLRYTGAQRLAYWLVAMAAVVPPSAVGTRRFIIPSVLIMIVGSFARTWNRRVHAGWFAAGVGAFLALAIIPFVRSAGSRVGGQTDLLGAMSVYLRDEGVQGTVDNFFLSYDTEMFNYVAYFAPRWGDSIPFGFGRATFGEIVTTPLPASLSPFERWADVLLSYPFGAGCTSETACPVPSVVGVLYSDWGLVSLVYGMLILGAMAAGFERALRRSAGAHTAVLLLTSGFAVLFARGNSTAQVWIAVQVFALWWVVSKVAALPVARRARRERVVRSYPAPAAGDDEKRRGNRRNRSPRRHSGSRPRAA